jgi:hypothetical protein
MEHIQPPTLIHSPFPNVGEMPVSWGRDKDTRHAGNHKAIVGLDTGKVYSIVSRDYRLIRHEDAITEVEQELSGTKGLGEYEAITDFYNGGGRMRRTYRFKNVGVEIMKGDVINPELHLFNSYDTRWPFVVSLGAFRVVCTNGLVVGERYLNLRKRHVYEIGQIDIREEVGTAISRFKKQARQWKVWAGRMLSQSAYSRTLEAMKLGVKAKEVIEGRVLQEAEDVDQDGFPIVTAWGLYNVLTWYISHHAVSLNHRVYMEGRLRAASRYLMG